MIESSGKCGCLAEVAAQFDDHTIIYGRNLQPSCLDSKGASALLARGMNSDTS
jgi:hypothetical protein